tara:strand:- start:281 stop:802 length:522 start_codon:yes stop_codon:yes gene_type:complete
MKAYIKKMSWVLAVLFLFLHSGCGLLNYNSFKKENGNYIRHYNSCGPDAIQDAMKALENKLISKKNISTEIQSNGNVRRTLIAAIVHHNGLWVTFPSELKKYFSDREYEVTNTTLDSLVEGDVAIVLIKGRIVYGEWHWITWPTYSKEKIKNYYKHTDTSVIKVYKIKKRAAN